MASERDRWLAALQQLLDVGSDSLSSWRREAWSAFAHWGASEKKQENFQYLGLHSLYGTPFRRAEKSSITPEKISSHILPECRDSALVFVNGVWSPELSSMAALPPTLLLLPLREAMRSYGPFLQQRLRQGTQKKEDLFTALNGALHPSGLFLYLPPRTICTEPIQCLFWTDAGPLLASPRLHISMGASAEATLLFQTLSQDSASWVNAVSDFHLEEEASLSVADLLLSSTSGWHFDSSCATLKKGARLHAVGVTAGAPSLRRDWRVSLKGEAAECKLEGLSLLSGENAHVCVQMEHVVPHTRSMQHFKNVLQRRSLASFQGEIVVQKEAQKTEAYQLNRNLLLGDLSHAYTKPRLQIFADDVKASHGATTAQMDERLLFYLKTRGIDGRLARTLVLRAFCKPLFDQLPRSLPSLAERTEAALMRFMEERHAP